MGKNSKAKKTRTKNLTYKEAREKTLRCIRMTMCTQMGALVDVMHPTHDQMIDIMNLSQKYTEYLEKYIAKLNDIADIILKETGVDIHIFDEDVKCKYSMADLQRPIKVADVERAIRKGWLEIHAEIDEEDFVTIILKDRRTGERVTL